MLFDLRVVCYINGLRFDPRSVCYFATAGQLESFQIDVPAVPEWDILPVRSHCVVFFTDPVTRSWRMLCEGEYVETQKSKQGIGTRNRTLIFRSLLGYWESANYVSLMSTSNTSNDSGSPIDTMVTAWANGQRLPYEKQGENAEELMDLRQVINTGVKPETKVSTFIPTIVRTVTLQTPVETYYMYNRKIENKFHAMEDDNIESIINYKMFMSLADGSNMFGYGGSTTLQNLIRIYEDYTMYIHTSIPSPHVFTAGGRAANEMKLMANVFIPHLYSVIPPACNVIFYDQIQVLSWGRSLISEPTRVIASTLTPLTMGTPAPFMYMINSEQNVSSFMTAMRKAKTAPVGMSHDFLTEEELLKGVVPSFASIGFEKFRLSKEDANAAANRGESPQDRMDFYIQEAVKHQYILERGKMRTCQLTCSFLPYVVPGFPCLIEDTTGSFFGLVQSVQHTLPCTGTPSTTVTVTHVREAYVQQGVNRSGPFPRWLNSAFHPANITQTYKELLGLDNWNGLGSMRGDGVAAMVPEQSIVEDTFGKDAAVRLMNPDFVGDAEADSTYGESKQDRQARIQAEENKSADLTVPPQANLDELARKVVQVPTYSADLSKKINDGSSDDYIAKRLRAMPQPDFAFLSFQYRNGTGISQYNTFHGLATTLRDMDSYEASILEDLDADGFSGIRKKAKGHPLFSHPERLEFLGVPALAQQTPTSRPVNLYGVYQSAGEAFLPLRQNATIVIKEAVDKMITAI